MLVTTADVTPAVSTDLLTPGLTTQDKLEEEVGDEAVALTAEMKGPVWVILGVFIAVACLIALIVVLQTPSTNSLNNESNPHVLDGAPEAVDDMYLGCENEMMMVIDKYFQKENVGKFKTAWKNAEKCSNKLHLADTALTKNHMQAICAYTSNDIYKEFNEAVRTGKNIYGSSFKFHYLHFWLTSAIQILKSEDKCITTYRRNDIVFTGKVNQTMRFGEFASSSTKTELTKYGIETCFKINTCLGAYLKDYTANGTKEEEVLIPPYETFKITHATVGLRYDTDLPDCKKVFILKSVGKMSNLNCTLIRERSLLQMMQNMS
ncbi:ecto-ADP-ribosyltransferase 4-like [Scomber scombrus]|uniref:ecto-ADP-ribosyltransferase 4-like n=1 Tax=Scomber scombrus TaxID=13677 RepID=UPI002DD83276|nr:ecto-ADP-ribosyltransferase 4-like [Scomber scombrus]